MGLFSGILHCMKFVTGITACCAALLLCVAPLEARPLATSAAGNHVLSEFEKYGVRASTGGDNDADGIPDEVDVDDDNDTIFDDVEGLEDADGDGVANCLDLDSDNDGITDLSEAISDRALLAELDSNADGLLDEGVFLGANGLADRVETFPDSSESITGFADDDRDGVVDQLDLDSDNDGLPDLVELGRADADLDAMLDFFRDTDGDGRSDTLSQFPINVRDSDGDGVFDFRDIDSDQDGLTDRLESSFGDVDGDGRIDIFVDNNGDGLYDDYPAEFVLADSDSDGVPNHIDTDSDNDGVPDSEEAFNPQPNPLPDSESTTEGGSGSTDSSSTDGDGTDGGSGSSDSGSSEPQSNTTGGTSAGDTIETGRAGNVFGCALYSAGDKGAPQLPGLALLLVLVVLFRHWQSRAFRLAALAVAIGILQACTTSANHPSVTTPQFHLGVGFGISNFDIETGETGREVSSSQGTAAQLTLGVDISRKLSVEGRVADLGEATFRGSETLGYQVADVSGIYTLSKNNLNAFGRLGLGALFNDGGVSVERANDYHVLVGLGIDYRITPQWRIRAEWNGHDVDVNHAQLSLVYRLGQHTFAPTAVVAETIPDATPVNDPLVEDTDAIVEPLLVETVDSDNDGVTDARDRCSETPKPVIVDSVGCTLVGGVVDGLDFVYNSDEFVASADSSLSELVKALEAEPDLRLIVAAHTPPGGDSQVNLLLSRKRALAIIRYLQDQGIDSTRLRPVAFGDTQPFTNPEHPSDHERVELLLQ